MLERGDEGDIVFSTRLDLTGLATGLAQSEARVKQYGEKVANLIKDIQAAQALVDKTVTAKKRSADQIELAETIASANKELKEYRSLYASKQTLVEKFYKRLDQLSKQAENAAEDVHKAELSRMQAELDERERAFQFQQQEWKEEQKGIAALAAAQKRADALYLSDQEAKHKHAQNVYNEEQAAAKESALAAKKAAKEKEDAANKAAKAAEEAQLKILNGTRKQTEAEQKQQSAAALNLRRFTGALGFGLVSSGLPGASQAGSIAIGSGLGGAPGAAGAAAAVGITAAINVSKELLSLWVELAKKAYDISAAYESTQIALQAIMATTLRFQREDKTHNELEANIENFRLAGEAAKVVHEAVLEQSIPFSGTADELTTAYQAFITGGGMVLVQNEKINDGLRDSVKITRLLAEAIKQSTLGQPEGQQLPQEINAFLTGRSRASDRLSRIVYGDQKSNPDYAALKTQFQDAIKLGTAYEWLTGKLSGFDQGAEKFGKTAHGLTDAITTMQNEIVRLGFQDAFTFLEGKQEQFLKILLDNKVALQDMVKHFAELTKDSLMFAEKMLQALTFTNSTEDAFKRIVGVLDSAVKMLDYLFKDKTKWDAIAFISSPSAYIGAAIGQAAVDKAKDVIGVTGQAGKIAPYQNMYIPNMERANTNRDFKTDPLIRSILTRKLSDGTELTGAQKQQLAELNQVTGKKKEELDLTEKILLLELQIASITAKRKGDVIEEGTKLRQIGDIKENIAALSRKAKEDEEYAALQFYKAQTSPIDKAQAKNKYIETQKAAEEAENAEQKLKIDNAKAYQDFYIEVVDNIYKDQSEARKEFNDYWNDPDRAEKRLIQASNIPSTVDLAGHLLGRYTQVMPTPNFLLTRQIAAYQSQLNANADSGGILRSQFALTGDQGYRGQIRQNTTARVDIEQQLLASMQQLRLVLAKVAATPTGNEPQDTENINNLANLDNQINTLKKDIIDLTPHTLRLGEAFRNTFEIAIDRISAFQNVIGATAGKIGVLGRSITDLSKIKLANGEEAGSIGAGLGAITGIFHRKDPNFTGPQQPGGGAAQAVQGIGAAIGIASAVVGVITTLRAVMTAAAKKMADAISKSVDDISNAANKSGKLQTAIDELQAQRNKALTDLGSKKGGQKELDTLLPKINGLLDDIKAKQKVIVDGFEKALSLLDTSDVFTTLTNDFETINKQVVDFINAAGDAEENYGKAFDFIEKSAAKMMANLQKQTDDENKAWLQGAEDVQGNLISINDDFAQKKLDDYAQYVETVNTLEKTRAKAIKDNNKSEIDDLKKIEEIKQAIIDLNDQEVKDIKAIQNQGITEREVTTENKKAQDIADLQNANKKTRTGLATQLDDIEAARAERQAAFLENLANIDKEEATNQLNHDNTFKRLNAESDRAAIAHLQRLADIEAQKAKIIELENIQGLAILKLEHLEAESLARRATNYQEYLSEIEKLEAESLRSRTATNPTVTSSTAMQTQMFTVQRMPLPASISVGTIAVNIAGGTDLAAQDISNAVQDALRQTAIRVLG